MNGEFWSSCMYAFYHYTPLITYHFIIITVQCTGSLSSNANDCVVVDGYATLYAQNEGLSDQQLSMAQRAIQTTMTDNPTLFQTIHDGIVRVQYQSNTTATDTPNNNDMGSTPKSPSSNNNKIVWGSVLLAFGVLAVVLVGFVLLSRRRRRRRRRQEQFHPWSVLGIQARGSFDPESHHQSFERANILHTSWDNHNLLSATRSPFSIPTMTTTEQQDSKVVLASCGLEFGPPKSITTTTRSQSDTTTLSWAGDGPLVLDYIETSSVSSQSLYTASDLDSQEEPTSFSVPAGEAVAPLEGDVPSLPAIS